MNKKEAKQILEEEVKRLKQKTYNELKFYLKNPHCYEVKSSSNIDYQVEVEAYESTENNDLTVLVSIDDGKLLWGFIPITPTIVETFVITKDV